MSKFALLAGEASGDILGGSLMAALSARDPDIRFDGIGGPNMSNMGLQSAVDMERLSVMGLFEPLKRLPELLRIKREYVQRCLDQKPDLFIGIDSPDFNLRVAAQLHAEGIRTAHYVSPSVWAWRQKRVLKIKQSIDLMLTLFPFEEQFYQQHNVPVCFVGHPLADELPVECDKQAHRLALSLPSDPCYVAVLPGSRRGESQRMMPLFLDTMMFLNARRPDIQYLIPAANESIKTLLLELLREHPLQEKVVLLDGQSQHAMGAADTVLLASGTSTLEAMLLKTPMVMAYKLSAVTYNIVKHMITLPYFALPNLLAGEKLVPEFIQHEAHALAMGQAVLDELENPERQRQLQQRFIEIHHSIRRDASARAADALLSMPS